MIIPIRCFTCNKVIANKYNIFLEEKKEIDKSNTSQIIDTSFIEEGNFKKSAYGELLDKLEIKRYCCRRMFLGQVDIVDII